MMNGYFGDIIEGYVTIGNSPSVFFLELHSNKKNRGLSWDAYTKEPKYIIRMDYE